MIRKLTKKVFVCDFCGIDQDAAAAIVAGPDDVAICQECIRICVDIIEARVSVFPQASEAKDAAP